MKKKNMVLIGAILSLPLILLQGCAEPFVQDMVVDSAFSDSDVTSIQDAMDAWRAASDGAIDIRVSAVKSVGCESVPTGAIARCTDTDPYYLECVDATGEKMVASTSASHNAIQIVPELALVVGLTMKTVALHEIGHLIGLHHTTDGGLMDPDTKIEYIDEDTLHRACELHGCSK